MATLTSRDLAQSTAITPTTLIHIVTTGDTTQSSSGSSYKAQLSQLTTLFGSGGNYWTSGSSGTDSVVIINSSGLDATANRALAWGNQTLASGSDSTASGFETQATGSTSTAQGYQTIAGGSRSHAEGFQSRAMGTNSHSEGNASEANGNTSHAEGWVCIANGDFSHAEGWITRADGNRSHSQGHLTIASSDYSHAGGYSSIASGETSFIHSTNSLVTGARSVLLGGQNLTGTTDDVVYVPNLIVRHNNILHSDSTLELTPLVSSIKGSFTEFNWTGQTVNIISNGNVSGQSLNFVGDFSNFPADKKYGSIGYYNTSFDRNIAPINGDDFYANKFIIKGGSDINGMVINPKSSDPSGTIWFEMDGSSVMKIKGDGVGGARLGIAMNQEGTEDATANLQIGGSGTTGTFRYVDGNQVNGYVLTSDASGNASWQASSGGGVTIDPYEDVGNVNSITWDVSGTSTNYEATLTGNTTLDLTNVRNGDYGTIIIKQDGVGSRTITLGNVNGGAVTHRVANGGGGSIILTSNASATDILTFTYNGSIMYWTVGNDYT